MTPQNYDAFLGEETQIDQEVLDFLIDNTLINRRHAVLKFDTQLDEYEQAMVV